MLTRTLRTVLAAAVAVVLPVSVWAQEPNPSGGPKPGHAYMVGQALPGVCKMASRGGIEVGTIFQRWYQGGWANAAWLPDNHECVQVLERPGIWRMKVFQKAYEPDSVQIVGPFVVVDRGECTDAGTKIVRVDTPNGGTSGLEGLQGKHLLPNEELTSDANVDLYFADGSKVAIAKGSAFKLDGCAQPTAPGFPPLIKFQLLLGRIWSKIDSGQGKIEIRTERVVAGNRGTTFWISYDDRAKLTTVHVDQGSVWMRVADKTTIVAAGQTATQHAGEAPVVQTAPISAGK